MSFGRHSLGLLAWLVALTVALGLEAQPTQVGPRIGHDGGYALVQLESMRSGLSRARVGLHEQDEARWHVLQSAVEQAIDSVKTRGIAHQATAHRLRTLLVRVKFSSELFRFVRTRRTDAPIRSTLEAAAALRRHLGLDEEAASRVLEAHLRQLKSSFDELQKRDGVPETLKKKIAELAGPLGDALSMASLGDDARAMSSVRELVDKVRLLYPLLHKIAAVDPLFGIGLEVRGVNEFLGAFVKP